jgi:hypothetical protein
MEKITIQIPKQNIVIKKNNLERDFAADFTTNKRLKDSWKRVKWGVERDGDRC